MKKVILTAGLCTMMMIGLNAQTTTPRVGQKQVNQQVRIADGVKDGELNRRETRQLQRQQAEIQRNKRIAKADGVVTPAERASLRQDQRQASRNIYRKKHNGR